MQEVSKRISKERLQKMDAEDKARKDREEAHNTLEAFMYAARDFLENKIVLIVTTPEQRSVFQTEIESTSGWLSENGESATNEAFTEKLSAIKAFHTPINYRKIEHEGRKLLIKKARETLDEVRAWHELALQNMTKIIDANALISLNTTSDVDPEEVLYKDTELVSLNENLAEMESWLESTISDQEKLDASLEPILTMKSVQEKIKVIFDAHGLLLRRRPAYKKLKKKVVSTSASATSTTATSDVLPTDIGESDPLVEDEVTKDDSLNEADKIESDEETDAKREEL